MDQNLAMQVTVILHSILREKLPLELKGNTTLELSNGATILKVIEQFDLPIGVGISLNDEIHQDLAYILKDGDMLRFFLRAGGG